MVEVWGYCRKYLLGAYHNQARTSRNLEPQPGASDLEIFFKNYSKALVGERDQLWTPLMGDFFKLRTRHLASAQNWRVIYFLQNSTVTDSWAQDLDLEYAMALAYPQQATLYRAGDFVEGASFNNFLDANDSTYCTGHDTSQDCVYPDPYCAAGDYGSYKGPETCGGFAATKVISLSYGVNEADLTPAYETRQFHEYLKLGLQGVMFLYAS